MREVVSRIQRIGLVNSGMFDLLDLNTDVRAMHLVGDNNVGKTSLIELIQFLYFPQLSEMHFSKTLPETLSFYFRPEGSYLLFELRTLRGTLRTLGIFGAGTADSRQVFVFDGPYTLTDFLDAQQHVIGLQQLGPRLANRRFHIYPRVEDHERGLIGEHSDDRANVQLFDLPRGNFRLLRKLLQNLLRLERLTSRDIRLFLNTLVESSGAKTRIDMARDFDRKYGEIKVIRDKIANLNRLRPLIDQWTLAAQRLEQARTDEQATRHRLSHATHCVIAELMAQRQALTGRLAILNGEQQQLEDERQRFADTLASDRNELQMLEQQQREHQQLLQHCAGRQEAEVRAERDQLTYQAIELQKTIDRVAATSLGAVTRKVNQLREAHERLRRQIEQRTIAHVIDEAGLDEETRILLRFLVAEGLLSLAASHALVDLDALMAAARSARTMLDADGVFRGFGLRIAREEWYRPLAQQQSLAERVADTERQLIDAEHELAVATDHAEAQRRLSAIHRQAAQCEELLRAFQRLHELDALLRATPSLSERVTLLQQRMRETTECQQQIAEQHKRVIGELVTCRSDSDRLDQLRHEHASVLRDIGGVTGSCPEDIARLAGEDLRQLVTLTQRKHNQSRSALQSAQTMLGDAQAHLADLHERETTDVSFDAWIADKQLLTSQVERLEGQLRESYANLMTLVKGELDKLTQAFEVVRNRVAELNSFIRKVSISNIERIELQVQESHLVEAIRQTSRIQLDLFSSMCGSLSLQESERLIEEFVIGTLQVHGRELSLDDLFLLEFRVTFAQTGEQRTVAEIHAFESNGTAIGVKIVVYLGLIKLLQGSRRGSLARIPFFLDEVGSLSSNNVRQIIAYCDEHNFLPIFASPTVRDDIPHSYVLRRFGERSQLVTEIVLTERETIDASASLDAATRA